MKLRRAVPMLGLLSALATPALAQQAAAAGACNIDQNKPNSVKNTTLSLVRLQGATKPEERGRILSQIVGQLSSEKSKDNLAGQNYMLAQALIAWAGEPGMGGSVARSMLGYTTEPQATIDVLAAADSALKRFAEAAPGCAPQAAQLRQNQAWLNQINSAIAALNAGKADSAEYYANRSLLMYTGSPYAYHVLSSVAQNKNDDAKATEYWQKVVETAGTDTAYRDLRSSAMFNIAITKAQAVEAAQGAQQKQLAKDAASALQAFAAANPTSPDALRAQPTLVRMLLLSGDTAAVVTSFSDKLANPSKYSDLDLTQSGVTASQIGRSAEAAKLFDAALSVNPYQRDALNNLSATLLQMKQFDKIVPIASRLVALDPSNPDNYAFISLAYNGLASAAAATAKKAFNDSALKYYQMSEAMPVKVTFNEFTRAEARSVVGMTIEALSPNVSTPAAATTPARPGAAGRTAAAAKPAAPAAAASPKTYTVKFDFLDKSGNVVDSQTQTVGPIAPGERKPVRFETTKPGVVAFRYAPLQS
jgi:lipopolysaccharide biosynthesis regulator YciM